MEALKTAADRFAEAIDSVGYGSGYGNGSGYGSGDGLGSGYGSGGGYGDGRGSGGDSQPPGRQRRRPHGPRMDRPAGAARSGGHPFPAQRVCGPRPPKR